MNDASAFSPDLENRTLRFPLSEWLWAVVDQLNKAGSEDAKSGRRESQGQLESRPLVRGQLSDLSQHHQ